MRFIGLHKDLELREIQVNFLTEVISKCKNQKEIQSLVENIISASELAYISQRLHIIKLVLDDKTYPEIKNTTGTTSGTINTTKILMKSMNRRVLAQIAQCKFKDKPRKKNKVQPGKKHLAEAHYPGAIKTD